MGVVVVIILLVIGGYLLYKLFTYDGMINSKDAEQVRKWYNNRKSYKDY